MRTFKHFNKKSVCPICKTNKDKECVLIPFRQVKGLTREAKSFHLDCIDLWMYTTGLKGEKIVKNGKELNLIAQPFEK